jgi:hypothetical protein
MLMGAAVHWPKRVVPEQAAGHMPVGAVGHHRLEGTRAVAASPATEG